MKYIIKEIKDSWSVNYKLICKKGEEPVIVFTNYDVDVVNPGTDREREIEVDVEASVSELWPILEDFVSDEEYDAIFVQGTADEELIRSVLSRYLEKGLEAYWNKYKEDFIAEHWKEEKGRELFEEYIMRDSNQGELAIQKAKEKYNNIKKELEKQMPQSIVYGYTHKGKSVYFEEPRVCYTDEDLKKETEEIKRFIPEATVLVLYRQHLEEKDVKDESPELDLSEAVKDSHHHFMSDLGEIPTAGEIMDDILTNYPSFKKLDEYIGNDIKKYHDFLKEVQMELNRQGLEYKEE